MRAAVSAGSFVGESNRGNTMSTADPIYQAMIKQLRGGEWGV